MSHPAPSPRFYRAAEVLLVALLALLLSFGSAAGAPAWEYVSEIHFAIRTGISTGDVVLLVRPDGLSMSFDAGDLRFGNNWPSLLDGMGITQVNVVLSHCHPDHAAGLLPLLVLRPELVRYIIYPWGEDFPDCLLVQLQNGQQAPERLPLGVYQQALEATKLKFLPLTGNTQDTVHKYLGNSVTAVRPNYDYHRTPKITWNDRSLTLCVNWPNGDTSLLFGDTRVDALDSLFCKPEFVGCLRKADFLLANHHGTSEENSKTVLAEMRSLRDGKPFPLLVICSQDQTRHSDLNAEFIRAALNARQALRTAYGDIRIDCPSAHDPCAFAQTP